MHARRLGAAARDAEQQPHARALRSALSSSTSTESRGRPRRRLRALGDHVRREHVRRLVARDPARGSCTPRGCAPAPWRCVSAVSEAPFVASAHVGRRAAHSSGTPLLCRPPSTLREDDALGGALQQPLRRRGGQLAPAKRDGDVIHPARASRQHPCRRHASREVGAETGPRTRADERHAARCHSCVTGVRNSSYGFPVISRRSVARRTSPPVAASRPAGPRNRRLRIPEPRATPPRRDRVARRR